MVHALLIGIDGYAAGPRASFRALRGCVADVIAVEAALRRRGGVDSVTMLVEPGEDVAGAGRPTYANIVAAWRRVRDAAGEGGQVYVHYSGHGAQRPTMAPAERASRFDEAIVPCDVHAAGGRYLRDLELVWLLREMAARRQVVTIVMDTCHAGGVLETIEVSEPVEGPGLVVSDAELRQVARSLRDRNATWSPGDEPGYVMLAACQAEEHAQELRLADGTRRGALTAAWIETLDRCGPETTYAEAFQRVLAEVRRQHGQAAALVGARARRVLGAELGAVPAGLAVLEVNGAQGTVRLGGGAAMAVAVGSEYAIVPFAGDEAREGLPIVRVEHVLATFAQASVVRGDAAAIARGDRAVWRWPGPRPSGHRERFRRVAAMRHDDRDAAHAGAVAVELDAEPRALRIANRSAGELHVLVLELRPRWEIVRLGPAHRDGAMLAPGEDWTIALAASPPGARWKIVATRVPPDPCAVQTLLLPPLDDAEDAEDAPVPAPPPADLLETPARSVRPMDRTAWIAIDVAST